MPMAAFSSGDAIQYPYLATVPRKVFISSAVGGAGRRLGSNGLLTSPKNSYNFDVVTTTIVTGSDDVLRNACLTLPGITATAPTPTVVHPPVSSFDWKISIAPSRT